MFNSSVGLAASRALLPTGPACLARTTLLALLMVGSGAMAAPIDRPLNQLAHVERQDLYNYGIMSALAYREDVPLPAHWTC